MAATAAVPPMLPDDLSDRAAAIVLYGEVHRGVWPEAAWEMYTEAQAFAFRPRCCGGERPSIDWQAAQRVAGGVSAPSSRSPLDIAVVPFPLDAPDVAPVVERLRELSRLATEAKHIRDARGKVAEWESLVVRHPLLCVLAGWIHARNLVDRSGFGYGASRNMRAALEVIPIPWPIFNRAYFHGTKGSHMFCNDCTQLSTTDPEFLYPTTALTRDEKERIELPPNFTNRSLDHLAPVLELGGFREGSVAARTVKHARVVPDAVVNSKPGILRVTLGGQQLRLPDPTNP
jgi:hypothetical protein